MFLHHRPAETLLIYHQK